jgi:putative transposase
MNRHQQVVIEYLQEEIRVLKEQMGKRPRFNNDQRRRLAVKGKSVGRKNLLRLARIVPEPNGPWMKQVARNLIDGSDGFLKGCRYLLHDRASLFSEDFRMILKAAGVESVRLPVRSPNLNAFAERFVRSVKESCLDRMVLIGESSLHRATAQFVLHYHQERNHQGLDNKIIRPEFSPLPSTGPIRCRKPLGGMLNYYYREAA